MSDCERFSDLVQPYMEGELGEEEAGALKAHLEHCAGCRELLSDLRKLRELLGSVPRVEAGSSFSEEVLSKLDVRAEAKGGGGRFRKVLSLAAAFLLLVAGGTAVYLASPWTVSPKEVAEPPEEERAPSLDKKARRPSSRSSSHGGGAPAGARRSRLLEEESEEKDSAGARPESAGVGSRASKRALSEKAVKSAKGESAGRLSAGKRNAGGSGRVSPNRRRRRPKASAESSRRRGGRSCAFPLQRRRPKASAESSGEAEFSYSAPDDLSVSSVNGPHEEKQKESSERARRRSLRRDYDYWVAVPNTRTVVGKLRKIGIEVPPSRYTVCAVLNDEQLKQVKSLSGETKWGKDRKSLALFRSAFSAARRPDKVKPGPGKVKLEPDKVKPDRSVKRKSVSSLERKGEAAGQAGSGIEEREEGKAPHRSEAEKVTQASAAESAPPDKAGEAVRLKAVKPSESYKVRLLLIPSRFFSKDSPGAASSGRKGEAQKPGELHKGGQGDQSP